MIVNKALMVGLLCGILAVDCCADVLPVESSSDSLRAELLRSASKLTTVLPDQTIRVAQPFELQLQVETPDPVLVELADESARSFSDFDIVRTRTLGPVPVSLVADVAEQADAAQRFRTTLVLVLETVRAGQRDLPAFNVQVSAGESVFVLVSEAAEIVVEGVVPDDFDPMQFRDLKPPAEIEATKNESGVTPWLLILVILLLGVIFFFFRRSRTSDSAILQRWIAEIDSLENDVQNRALTLSIAHDEACERIRQWIQSSTGIAATSLPTDSLMSELQSRSLPESWLQRLSNMLSRNDEMKFAANAVHPESLSGVFDDARWLIRDQVISGPVESLS